MMKLVTRETAQKLRDSLELPSLTSSQLNRWSRKGLISTQRIERSLKSMDRGTAVTISVLSNLEPRYEDMFHVEATQFAFEMFSESTENIAKVILLQPLRGAFRLYELRSSPERVNALFDPSLLRIVNLATRTRNRKLVNFKPQLPSVDEFITVVSPSPDELDEIFEIIDNEGYLSAPLEREGDRLGSLERYVERVFDIFKSLDVETLQEMRKILPPAVELPDPRSQRFTSAVLPEFERAVRGFVWTSS